jgi:hypothetical protein
MRLNDPLYTPYEINGKIIELDLSFDNILDVLDVLNDETLDEYDKLSLSCDLLVSNIELNVEENENDSDDNETKEPIELNTDEKSELYLYVKDTYIEIGEENFIERDILGNPMPDQSEKTIDFEKDAKFIFASFFALGINLYDQQGKLTWMEFQALMNALPDDSIMTKIINIRNYTPQAGESPEYKEQMFKLQKKYSLIEREEEEDV